MRTSFKTVLWTLVGIGTGVSLMLAFVFFGVAFDIDNMGRVGAELSGPAPLELYSKLNQELSQGFFYRWPYPPGFFAWIVPTTFTANHSAVPFHGLIQIPMIVANAAVALVVQAYLGARGADDRTRLIAAAAVVCGPIFVGISGYHGQLDALAIFPAVVALVVWERRSSDVFRSLGTGVVSLAARLDPNATQRALATGLLVGAGAAVKTIPILILVALVPTARRLREAAILVTSAVAVPVTLLIPFLIADPNGVETLGDYSGAPGLGGLGLAVQPDLAVAWMERDVLDFNAVNQFLFEHAGQIVQLVMLAVFIFLLRFRPPPVNGVVLVWISVYAFSPNFFFQYLVWGIPFFLMAGYIRETVLLQAAVLIPLLITFSIPWPNGRIAAVYVPIMLVVWVGFLAAFVNLVRRRGRGPDDPGIGSPRLDLDWRIWGRLRRDSPEAA